MKIQTWNIRHGGKRSAQGVLDTILQHDADIVVLTEYRTSESIAIKDALLQAGWSFYISSEPPDKTNGVGIFSKTKILRFDSSILPESKHRWIGIYAEEFKLKLLGIHIPGISDGWNKEDFWKCVIDFAEHEKQEKTVITGDFNTGLSQDAEGTPFALSEYMEKLIDIGWVDAWRLIHGDKREYSWYSQKNGKDLNGFRLDYAFLSPAIQDTLINAFFSHKEREEGHSDHSSLIIELG